MTTATKTPKKHQPTHVDRDPQPYTGPTTIDASAVASLLRDLPPGAMQGLRKPQPGLADVVTELTGAVPTYGATAGISTAVYTSFTTHTANIAKLVAAGAAVSKLAEVITESLALEEDAQDQDLGQIVDAILSTTKRTKSNAVSAPFQKTLAYRSEVAKKAAATREKNAAAKKAATTTTATPTAGTTAATPVPATPAAAQTTGH
jgi:hypothetical protein